MPRERIKSKQELSDYIARKYRYYNNVFWNTHGEQITKYYLKDFMTDLLLIQNFANSGDNDGSNDGEGREEGLADVS